MTSVRMTSVRMMLSKMTLLQGEFLWVACDQEGEHLVDDPENRKILSTVR